MSESPTRCDAQQVLRDLVIAVERLHVSQPDTPLVIDLMERTKAMLRIIRVDLSDPGKPAREPVPLRYKGSVWYEGRVYPLGWHDTIEARDAVVREAKNLRAMGIDPRLAMKREK